MNLCTATRSLPLLLALLVSATAYQAAASQASGPEGSGSNFSELRLNAPLIQGFLRVIYFTDGGRFHFREYSACSYEFIQNPSVSVKDGLVHISAEYYRRRGTGVAGGCLGGPGTNTEVTLSARPFAEGSAVALEILEIKTERMPDLTSALLSLAGVELPMTHTFDLMAAMNRTLRSQQSFGISSLEVHQVLAEENAIRVRLTMQLGIW